MPEKLMYTIGQLAKKFGLSRSTLLYYDQIGLLQASNRTSSNYRLYSKEDAMRLDKIRFYRQVGLSLPEISRLLMDASSDNVESILEKRLEELNKEIHALKDQQQVIVKILKLDCLPEQIRGMNKEKWVQLLKSAGLDDQAMEKWHMEFERLSPDGHQDFLESLGIKKDEIIFIRKWSGYEK